MPAERNAKLDHAKLFFVFCVVLGHVLSNYEDNCLFLQRLHFYIYLFHVPGFVFLSGLFAKSSVKAGRWDKAASFLMLLLFMTVIRYACALLRREPATLDLVSVTDARWYALGMFSWYAAAILVKKANAYWVIAVSILLSMAAGFYTGHVNTLAWIRIVNFFPFFFVGLMTDSGRLMELLGKKTLRAASLLILLAAAALVCWKTKRLMPWLQLFRGMRTYANIDTELPLWTGALWRLMAFPVSMVTALAWISLMPGKTIPKITAAGGKTLSIYAFHSPVYRTILYFIPVLDEWIRKLPEVLVPVFAVLILVLCALPIFDRSVRKFMNLVVRKEENA
ncbi:MAG: hypothetical protein K6A39_04460 [Clostridiales bacterium]|nr:hypothetical protein [Clostridiales bacterium]